MNDSSTILSDMLTAVSTLHSTTSDMVMNRYDESQDDHIQLGCATLVAAIADLTNYSQSFFTEEEIRLVENAYDFALTTIHEIEQENYSNE